MRDLLKKMRDDGRTVFVNSHLLGELETVCDSVVILKQGIVVKHGRLDDLTRESRRFEVVTSGLLPPELLQKFTSEGISISNNKIEVEGEDPSPVQPVIDALRAAGVVICSVQQTRQSLEDLFMESVTDDYAREVAR